MTNHERPDQPDPDQLDWLAFCYASGELSAAQTEQFEARLAGDQAAREALAHAVELTQTIAAAESHGTSGHGTCGHVTSGHVTLAATTRRDWNSRLSWMAIGSLASLLVALLWSGVVGPTWRTARNKPIAAAQQHLAFAWSQTRNEIASVKAAGLWPMTEVISELDSELPSDFAAGEMEIEEAPSWLTAAVLGQSENSPESDSFSSEPLEN